MRARRLRLTPALVPAAAGIGLFVYMLLPFGAGATTEPAVRIDHLWQPSLTDISQADGVVLSFRCLKTPKGPCPATLSDVVITALDGDGDPLGSASLSSVSVPGGAYFDFDPDIPIGPIESMEVQDGVTE
jgi:hypothetical protein